MNDEITRIIERCVGEPCTRRAVGRMKSLSVGFGGKAQRGGKAEDNNYRIWEFGTYNASWRVVRNGCVLCGSQDVADVPELNAILGSIELGRFASIMQINNLDVRLSFDNEVAIDFMTTFSDDDESLHIFMPEQRCVKFSIRTGWRMGPASTPWPAEV